ncbi:MAG: competence/damage-inducible protein A [Desulfobacterales bacterium]|nr:competence/damage-inducible protein A [Desulfobacterales bacterium]MDD4071846.1 competence/damage-inducible protein A [Desulfobacterales bacterium]MDD4392553.1 competence/damage-inducible protein A [Desulfobacterales bacterium]
MIAEILSTGDEIRTGSLVDTNSAYIAQKLEETGVDVVRHSCVGDDFDMLVSILKEIGDRADIAIMTGGLGPTTDDLTSEAAAAAAGVELTIDPDALVSMEEFFKIRKRPLTDTNKKQALLPKGARCLVNRVGTAPGLSMKIGRCVFFCLPGVPHEMRWMLSDAVLPQIVKLSGADRYVYQVRTMGLFGVGESDANRELDGFDEYFPDLKLGYRAHFPEVQIKVYARGKDAVRLNARAEAAAEWIFHRLGKWMYSLDGDPMEEEIGKLLTSHNATVAVAESCTGGLIAHWLTSVPGSSNYFLFSGVTYSNEAKINVLGVSPETINTCGAVHEQTAKEMAEGARRISGAVYGISTTGIAGPDGGSEEKPVGTVCIGLATPRYAKGYRFQYNYGMRNMNKEVFAMKALDLLRRELVGEREED